jgi:hypothetical protein
MERYSYVIIMLLSLIGVLGEFWMRPIMGFASGIVYSLLRQAGVPIF